ARTDAGGERPAPRGCGARLGGTGPRSTLRIPNGPRRRIQVPPPPVETEAFPCREHIVQRRRGEVADGREPREESFVVRNAAGHPRALKEDFGDKDSIRIPGPSPGEISTIRVVPGEQTCANVDRSGLARPLAIRSELHQ